MVERSCSYTKTSDSRSARESLQKNQFSSLQLVRSILENNQLSLKEENSLHLLLMCAHFDYIVIQCLVGSEKITFGTKMDLAMTCRDARGQVRDYLQKKASTFGGDMCNLPCKRCGHQDTRKRKRIVRTHFRLLLSSRCLCTKCLYQWTIPHSVCDLVVRSPTADEYEWARKLILQMSVKAQIR